MSMYAVSGDFTWVSGILASMPATPKKATKRVDHEKLTIYLPGDVIEAVKLLAVKQRRTYSAVIEGFVADGLEAEKKDEK